MTMRSGRSGRLGRSGRRAPAELATAARARLFLVVAAAGAERHGAAAGPEPADDPRPIGRPDGRPAGSLAGSLDAAVAARLPPSVRSGRLALDARGFAALALVGLVGVLLGVLVFGMARPESHRILPRRVPVVSTAAPAVPTPTVSRDALIVDVSGKVRNPGVVRLPPGARVIDALEAAGGAIPRADLTSLNLARPLVDGEQVLVDIPGAVAAAGPLSGVQVTPTQPVSLNTATPEQLDELPGIGPVLAQRIIEWRTANGGFTSIDELQAVNGIGEQRFADLEDRVTV
ncbi:MAG: helix-hairpin-helix domain-containing protein [Carbonactinosporaceae bacterium]